MDIYEAMRARHSVRAYEQREIEGEIKDMLEDKIAELNGRSGLHIQLITHEPKAFDSPMAHYGKFSGVTDYIAMIGKKDDELEEKCGYYGEKLVLFAQQLGLNTCWVAVSYKKIKTAYMLDAGEKLCIVIAIGYGKTQGVPHKSKAPSEVADMGDVPEWFKKGVEAALLAPTAVNQQKFFFAIADGKVSAKAGRGFYSRIDLGIAKCHFELGAGKKNFNWA
ncbi:MAG: nitroreductase family protein [Christensenellales bacterium]